MKESKLHWTRSVTVLRPIGFSATMTFCWPPQNIAGWILFQEEGKVGGLYASLCGFEITSDWSERVARYTKIDEANDEN